MDKKGVSEVITTILIIMITLTAVVVVWNVVNPLIKKSAEEVSSSSVVAQLEVENAEFYITGGGKVRVHRGSGKGNITSLKFIFYDENGESTILEKKGDDANCKIPGRLETNTCKFSPDEMNTNIEKISVVPVAGEKLGIEAKYDSPKIDLPSEGLVSWWKFEDNLEDSVGLNDGTWDSCSGLAKPPCSGNINYQDGDSRKSLLLESADHDFVNISDSADLKLGNQQTISIWIKPKSLPIVSDWARIIGKGITSRNYGLWQENATGRILFQVFGTPNNCSVYNSVIPIGSGWSYIAGTYDGNKIMVYTDGVETGSNACLTTPYTSADSLIIGAYEPPSLYFFNGEVDDAMIFNRVLSASEIKAVYNNQKK